MSENLFCSKRAFLGMQMESFLCFAAFHTVTRSSCSVSVGRCQVAGAGAVPGLLRILLTWGDAVDMSLLLLEPQQWLALLLATWWLVLPVLGRPHVSGETHMEGDEGTCGSVLSCFLWGCCGSPQTAQPLPFQPGECKQSLEQGWSMSSAGPRAQGGLHGLRHLNAWGCCSAAPAQPVGIEPRATEHPCAHAGSWDCPALILLSPWPVACFAFM